jgi:hypothetical protein
MKRLLPVLISLFFLAACTRQETGPRPPVDESYWLTRERGIVAYSDYACDFFIIETYNGYCLLRSWDGAPPINGSVVYGDFSRYGLATFYNRTEGYLMQADTREYWLSFWEARDQQNWNCSRP